MIIKTTDGYNIKVDIEDYGLLSRHNWFMRKGYAATIMGSKEVYMHRLIIGKIPTGMVADHINRDTLDNRKENLRPATPLQNKFNVTHSNSHGLVGVKKKGSRWIAKASVYNKEVYIGSADTALGAAKLRDAFVYAVRGEFAFLNFPDNKPVYASFEFPDRLKRYL